MITAQNLSSNDRYRFRNHTNHPLHKLAEISTGNEVVKFHRQIQCLISEAYSFDELHKVKVEEFFNDVHWKIIENSMRRTHF